MPNETAKETLSALQHLTVLPNVHIIPSKGLAFSLAKLWILPRAAIHANRTWYTNWRQDLDAARTYVSVYNDAAGLQIGSGLSSGNITLNTTGAPYVYNAWTGETVAITIFWQGNSTTTIPITLKGNESTIIAFHHDHQAPTKSERKAKKSCGDSVDLTKWELVIESWTAPDDPTAIEPQRNNLTFELTSLKPWNQISDSLRNVSGLGFYNTNFTWHGRDGRYADGAVLDLTALPELSRAWVNGHQLPALDPTNPVADVSQYLEDGSNKLQVVTASSLGNSLRPIWPSIQNGGSPPRGPLPAEQNYGLQLPATIHPYSWEAV